MALFLILMCLFAATLFRLYAIAVDGGERLTEAALRQQHVTVELASRQGFIYDRKGELLNYESGFGAALVEPLLAADRRAAANILSMYAAMPRDEVNRRLADSAAFGVELSRGDLALPGFTVIERASQLDRPPAVHTVVAIEAAYADYLESCGGMVYASLQRTAAGYALPGGESRLTELDYYAPGGLQLTLDADMQKAVEASWAGGSGAAVLMETSTGRLLALASFPSYGREDTASLLSSSGGELYNRALGRYNVGSVFKIIVAAQLIEREVDTPTLFCGGSTTVQGREFGCHRREGHGWVDFERAFLASCNPYFIGVLDEDGFSAALAVSRALGITTATRLAPDLYEEAGLLPTSAGGLVRANTAIGQGDIMATPLDLAVLLSTVASGGVCHPPRLVEGLIDREGRLLRDLSCSEAPTRVWSQSTSDRLMELLTGVCVRGTGTSAAPEGIAVAGKTASAETGWQAQDGGDVVHGIFAGLFPADDPRYALVVVVENGRSGSTSAAPVFRDIVQKIIQIDG